MSAIVLRPLCVFAFGVLLTGAAPAAAQISCRPVFDAIDKVMTTPTHMVRSVPGPGGEPKKGEAIYAGGAIYQKTGPGWERMPVTTAQAAKQERESRAKATIACRIVKDNDPVDGEPATLFESKTETKTETTTAQVWISKAKGLVLKQEIDIDAGKGGQTHYSVRYDYDKVEAPKL